MLKFHSALLTCLLATGLAVSAPARAEVWKCPVDGKTRYSDQPCPTAGKALPPRALQGNVVDTAADRAAARTATTIAPAAVAPAEASASVCPSDRDIANMETQASSISLGTESKRFIQDEIRRARQCRKGQGRYDAADWKLSQQAVDAQSSLSGAADARRRAEAMHSAADPLEGDRIARQREADARDALLRERALQRSSR